MGDSNYFYRTINFVSAIVFLIGLFYLVYLVFEEISISGYEVFIGNIFILMVYVIIPLLTSLFGVYVFALHGIRNNENKIGAKLMFIFLIITSIFFIIDKVYTLQESGIFLIGGLIVRLSYLLPLIAVIISAINLFKKSN